MITVLKLTVCVSLASAAFAQEAREEAAPAEDADARAALKARVHDKAREEAAPAEDADPGRYQGVVPAVRDEPAMPIPKGAPPTRLTFPGFQVREGRAARVFAQFSGPAAYETREEGGRFVVEFHNASVWRKNNLRRMDTRHFGTVVRGFQVRSDGKGKLRLEIDAKATQPPTVETQQSGAWHYVYVDFAAPPAEPAPAPSQAEDRERPR